MRDLQKYRKYVLINIHRQQTENYPVPNEWLIVQLSIDKFVRSFLIYYFYNSFILQFSDI